MPAVFRKMQYGHPIPFERDQEMFDLIKQGRNMASIGRQYGLSRERVRQIIKHVYSLTAKINVWMDRKYLFNSYLDIKDRIEAHRKHRQNVFHEWFGCHEEIVTYINGEVFYWNKEGRKSLAGEYIDQRRNSIRRGIAWKFTFPEWWDIWDKSGKYNQRGQGKYVMARWGDCGAYEKNNVYICTASENSKNMYTDRPDDVIAEHKLKLYDRGFRKRKSHCIRGHELSGDNIYVWPKRNTRQCKICGKIRKKIAYDLKHVIAQETATA